MSISDTINETQCENRLAVVSDFVTESLDKLKDEAGVDYVDLQVHGEGEHQIVIDQVHDAVQNSSIKAILVEDCSVLKLVPDQENLRSVLKIPVMSMYDHGTQLACLSSLLGFLQSKNKQIEDSKILIAKQENHGDYHIDHEQNSSQLMVLLKSLGAKNIQLMEENDD